MSGIEHTSSMSLSPALQLAGSNSPYQGYRMNNSVQEYFSIQDDIKVRILRYLLAVEDPSVLSFIDDVMLTAAEKEVAYLVLKHLNNCISAASFDECQVEEEILGFGEASELPNTDVTSDLSKSDEEGEGDGMDVDLKHPNIGLSHEEMVHVVANVEAYKKRKAMKAKSSKRKMKSLQAYIEANYPNVGPNYYRVKKYIENGGTTAQKIQSIKNFAWEQFQAWRNSSRPVHNQNLEKWCKEKAEQMGLHSFKCSRKFLDTFKREYSIVNRKITKYVTKREVANQETIENSATEFILRINDQLPNYTPDQFLNTDQSGFNFEMTGKYTLSYCGEKATHSIIRSMNDCTHSYTVQPTISSDGKLVGKVLIVLQEKGDSFGPRTSKAVSAICEKCTNVFVACTKSGKLTKKLYCEWIKNVLHPAVSSKTLLIIDSWSGSRDLTLFEKTFRNSGKSIEVELMPPKSTGLIQPLDVFFFLQLKLIVRRVYENIRGYDIENNDVRRIFIIKVISFVFNQLQSDRFSPMLKYSFKKSGYIGDYPDSFENAKQILFSFPEIHCDKCRNHAFIKCSYCYQLLCIQHCILEEFHYH